jgi:hypothetical protein
LLVVGCAASGWLIHKQIPGDAEANLAAVQALTAPPGETFLGMPDFRPSLGHNLHPDG